VVFWSAQGNAMQTRQSVGNRPAVSQKSAGCELPKSDKKIVGARWHSKMRDGSKSYTVQDRFPGPVKNRLNGVDESWPEDHFPAASLTVSSMKSKIETKRTLGVALFRLTVLVVHFLYDYCRSSLFVFASSLRRISREILNSQSQKIHRGKD
jgi:hypothetical protein